MFKVFSQILLITATVYILSCSESSPTETPPEASDIEFFLTFNQGGNFDITNDSILVFFTTNDTTSAPTVNINGQFITNFTSFNDTVSSGGLFGTLIVPFSISIDYSVSRDGKSTSGTTFMPLLPSDVYLNGILLEEFYTEVPYSSTLQFTWECPFYDFFTYSVDLSNDPKSGTTSNTFISIAIDDAYYGFYFYLGSAIGVDIGYGASLSEIEPNIKGDYGNGYVSAISDRAEYYIRLIN